jgi:hypothetical protein
VGFCALRPAGANATQRAEIQIAKAEIQIAKIEGFIAEAG